MTDCGTYAGYQAHRKANEEACTPCLVANREYLRDYRKRNPGYLAADAARRGARDRALRRLARLHPGEFRALYDVELVELKRRQEDRP